MNDAKKSGCFLAYPLPSSASIQVGACCNESRVSLMASCHIKSCASSNFFIMCDALLPNSIIHPNPVCAIGWSKVISWGDFKASLKTGQHFICNRLLQFRPGVFPIFELPYWFWKDKVGLQIKICDMNPHSSSDGVWFPNWAVVLARVRLKDLERRAYRLAIVGYLSFCKRSRQRATVASARLFMAEVEARRRLSRSQLALWKAALNWFFTTAQGKNPKAEMLPAENREGEHRTFNIQRQTSNIHRPIPQAQQPTANSGGWRGARNRRWRRRIWAGRSGSGI